MDNSGIKIILIYAMLCFLWGSTWLVIRAGLESLTPIVSAGLRFSLASLLVISLTKFRNIKIQKDKISIRIYLLMGFFSFVIPFGLVYWAEQFVPSGLAAVLFAVYPFFVALFSFLSIPGETIGIFKITGMFFGFTGIVVIFSDSFGRDISDYFLGMCAIVLSGIMQAALVVMIKKYGHHLNPISMNFFPMLIAGIVLLLLGFSTEDTSYLKFDLNAVLSIVYLAFFGSLLTFTSYYWLLKKINIVLLSLIAFITPIVALFLGWIFYNETLSVRHFMGSIMVLIGLLIANTGNVKRLNLRKSFFGKENN